MLGMIYDCICLRSMSVSNHMSTVRTHIHEVILICYNIDILCFCFAFVCLQTFKIWCLKLSTAAGSLLPLAVVSVLSCVWLFAAPWTIGCQVPLPMGFSRQEYWSGLPLSSPGELPRPGIEPTSPALAGSFLTLSHLGSLFFLCLQLLLGSTHSQLHVHLWKVLLHSICLNS